MRGGKRRYRRVEGSDLHPMRGGRVEIAGQLDRVPQRGGRHWLGWSRAARPSIAQQMRLAFMHYGQVWRVGALSSQGTSRAEPRRRGRAVSGSAPGSDSARPRGARAGRGAGAVG